MTRFLYKILPIIIAGLYFNLSLAFTLIPSAPSPGGDLKKGMKLVYQSSNGPSSIYEVLDLELNISQGENCSKITMTYDHSTGPSRIECISDGYLFEIKNGKTQVSRPINENLVFEKKNENGHLVSRYLTSTFEIIKLDAYLIKVINTQIYVYNDNGKLKYRLTEKYSPTLSTATIGTFEVPDPSTETGWKLTLKFELKQII